jgi:hypothetical protein
LDNLPALACIRDTTGSHPVDTDSPGYFDVGAGFTQIDTRGSTDAAASGVTVSIKAYPWGRWYAPRKQRSKEEVVKKSQVVADKQQKITDSKNTAEMQTAYEEKAKAEYDYLEAVQGVLSASKELYPLQDAKLYHRLSIFYARSPGSFNETVIKGAVNAIGIGIDIAPEFALIIGKAYYDELLPGGAAESRQHFIFGVQMNFNAFSAFRN